MGGVQAESSLLSGEKLESVSVSSPRAAGSTTYRNDIDGLRAVAVLLVVVYHVWLGRVSGGVDAFLMISAFLLTGSLLRKLESGEKPPVASQWIRNFKRMLPAAAIVIAATAIAGWFLLPESSRESLWRHSFASAFYVENWLLASESIDYYADTALASPLQHFWSLSIQGQVFLLWPLLFALIALLSRHILRRIPARRIALLVFGTVFIASFAYSVVSTLARQEFAYFDTGARLWEFALGSILAIVLPMIRLAPAFRAVLGWFGLIALLICGIVLDVQGGFPGYLALWPVLSVAAVIIAGSGENRRWGPASVLETKPVLALGRASYALYLVHWPILVFVLVQRRGEPLDFLGGLLVILGSVAVAFALTALVDSPLRKWTWPAASRLRGATVIAVSLALAAAPALTLQAIAAQQARQEALIVAAAPEPEFDLANPGAAVLFADREDVENSAETPRRPLPSEVPTQWGVLAEDCSDGSIIVLPKSMELCSTNGVSDPTRTIVVIGNSHAQQMLPAVEAAAERQNWRVISFLYAACAMGLREVDASQGIFYSQECRQWNEDVLDVIEELDPDAVVTIGTESMPAAQSSPANAGRSEHTLEGVELSIERLTQLGIPIVLIRDNPRFTFDSYQCVEQADDPERECSTTVAQALDSTNPAEVLEGDGVANIDLTDLYCPDGICLPVIGNVNVYIDADHLSLVYSRSMSPVVEEELVRALDEFVSAGFSDPVG